MFWRKTSGLKYPVDEEILRLASLVGELRADVFVLREEVRTIQRVLGTRQDGPLIRAAEAEGRTA